MDPIQWPKVVAWAATVLCVYFSARGADTAVYGYV